MPLDKNAMREYQRKRRAKTGATETNDTSEPLANVKNAKARNMLQGTPYRDEFDDLVLDRGSGTDLGGEHYFMRHVGDDFATCTEFEFYGPGRFIGGCGMVKQYEGKLLEGGLEPVAGAIINSDHFKEIQGKMPVTKTRG